jgi:hypothetical protein
MLTALEVPHRHESTTFLSRCEGEQDAVGHHIISRRTNQSPVSNRAEQSNNGGAVGGATGPAPDALIVANALGKGMWFVEAMVRCLLYNMEYLKYLLQIPT